MSKGREITLILNRRNCDLWLDTEEGYIAVFHGISGVKRVPGDYNPVHLLRGGEHVGIVWDIKEIKERW